MTQLLPERDLNLMIWGLDFAALLSVSWQHFLMLALCIAQGGAWQVISTQFRFVCFLPLPLPLFLFCIPLFQLSVAQTLFFQLSVIV